VKATNEREIHSPPENLEPYRSQRCIKKTLLLGAFLLELFLEPLLKTQGVWEFSYLIAGRFLVSC